jgi:hypothetical protein
VTWVARIDQNRMHLGTIGCSVAGASDPCSRVVGDLETPSQVSPPSSDRNRP